MENRIQVVQFVQFLALTIILCIASCKNPSGNFDENKAEEVRKILSISSAWSNKPNNDQANLALPRNRENIVVGRFNARNRLNEEFKEEVGLIVNTDEKELIKVVFSYQDSIVKYHHGDYTRTKSWKFKMIKEDKFNDLKNDWDLE